MRLRAVRGTVVLLLGLTWAAGPVSAWQATVNGRPASDMDDGLAVAVSPTGSVFVGGRQQTTATHSDFLVVKLSPEGGREWQQTIAGTADIGTSAGATALAVDDAGFVIAAGTVGNTASGSDFVIAKLDGQSPSPHVFWTRVVDGLGYDDLLSAIALTPDGGVVLAGLVTTLEGDQKFYLMKFTGAGEDAWAAPQLLSGNAPHGFNSATGVGVLPGGDIAVTGAVANTATNHDIVVVRFDGTTGQKLWQVTLNDPGFEGEDFARALAVAPNGDIVVGGSKRSPFNGADFAVFRFTMDGFLLWETIVDRGFADGAHTVAVAPNGDVVAGGLLETSSGPDNSVFFVVDLNAAGGERWRYERSGANPFLEALGIAFDSSGNPAVTGIGPTNQALAAFTVVALNRDTGAPLWEVPILGTVPLFNQGRAIASDSRDGSIVAVGVTQNGGTSFDVTATRITDGNEHWRQVITGVGQRADRDDGALAIALGDRRTIAVAGYRQNTGTGLLGTPHEFSVVKFGQEGARQWDYDLGDSLPHLDNAALATIFDSSGDVFAAGRTCATFLTSCFTVVRVGADGHELWRSTIGGASGRDEARALIQDPLDRNLIVAGRSMSAGISSLALLKLEATTGSVLWTASVPNISASIANAVALTPRGTVAVAGAVNGSFAVLEFDTTNGELMSTGILPGAGEARAVALDGRDGTVVAAGFVASSQSGATISLAKFDEGVIVWSTSVGSEVPSFAAPDASVAIQAGTGNIAVAGAQSSPQGFKFGVWLLDADGVEQWGNLGNAGFPGAVRFTEGDVLAVGQMREDTNDVFAVLAVAPDGTERWRRTFTGSAAFAASQAFAVAIDERSGSLFAVGVLANGATAPDMFVVGLRADGSDLPGRTGDQGPACCGVFEQDNQVLEASGSAFVPLARPPFDRSRETTRRRRDVTAMPARQVTGRHSD